MTPRRLLLSGLLTTLERERGNRRQARADEALERLLNELQEMAERLTATAHLGPPRTDDLSIAEHMTTALFLPVNESERLHHENVVDTWFHEHGYQI
jgi:hypothetical protein